MDRKRIDRLSSRFAASERRRPAHAEAKARLRDVRRLGVVLRRRNAEPVGPKVRRRLRAPRRAAHGGAVAPIAAADASAATVGISGRALAKLEERALMCSKSKLRTSA